MDIFSTASPLPTLSQEHSDGLPRANPSERNVSAARIAEFLSECGSLGVELNSLMIWRGGAVVAEGWAWPYRADLKHMMHSATKSFLSVAVGLAIEEGRFRLEDRVVSFFPEHVPSTVPPHLANMTVKDLLTQTSGHAHGTSGARWRGIPTSWIAEFLKIEVPYVPASTFRYSSATSFMLSAIITRTTGDNVRAYLQPRLFEPLGIEDLAWDMGPENINPGGNGISARTGDLLKLAILHLQGGEWDGRRVLPAAWVKDATTPKRGNPYGYHWWAGPRGSFYAYGVFGQFAFVFPEHDAIVVTTAATPYGEETLRSLVWSHFPAAFDAPLPADPWPDEDALAAQLASMRVLAPLPTSNSPLASLISGRRFEADQNGEGIRWLRFDFEAGGATLTVADARGEHRIDVGPGWIESHTALSGAPLHHGYEPDRLRVVGGGEWIADDEFVVTLQFIETAFRDTISIKFLSAKELVMVRSVNTNSMLPIRPPVTARALDV